MSEYITYYTRDALARTFTRAIARLREHTLCVSIYARKSFSSFSILAQPYDLEGVCVSRALNVWLYCSD